MNCNLYLPLNSLSFGFVSYNILREFYNRGISPNIFPVGGQVDISAYNNEEDFILWLNSCLSKAKKKYNRDLPSASLWHINGSEMSVGNKNSLMTFHECSGLTQTEVNILNNQNKVFVTSKYSKQVFEDHGVERPIVYTPLGFDSRHYKVLNKRAYPKDKCAIYLGAKWEKRKSTDQAIRLLKKKYGNNPNFVIHLQVYNQHLDQNTNQALLSQALEGNKPFNFNILAPVKTQNELNQCYNAIDIVLDLSKAESWSLPSFNCVALGKHAVVHNAPGISEWATPENSVLVESNGMEPAIDGIFFSGQGEFNIGNWFTFDENAASEALDRAVERWRVNPVNEEGLKLQNMTWFDSVNKIIENLS